MDSGIAGTFALDRHPAGTPALLDGPLALICAADARSGRDGSVECVLHGFLANAPELARDLGRPAGSQAAVVVAAGYNRDGEPFLGRLRGDFVIVLWDRERRRGLIARDQLGGRAMFLRRTGHGLAFATEIRDLLALLPGSPAPERTVLLHWLALQHHSGTETLYTGVEALLPGRLVRLGPDGTEVVRYWTPRYHEPVPRTFDEAVEEVRTGVDHALDRTLRGTSSVGVLMSGGLDSSSLAVLADRRPVTVRGYSWVFPDMPSVDESGYIDRVADAAGLDVTRMAVHGGSMLRSALRFSRDWRLPLGSQNLDFWAPLIARATDDGVDMMLDGEGGDLLFAARPELIGDRLRRGRLPAAARLVRSLPGADRATPRRQLSVLIGGGGRAALPEGPHQALRRRGAARRHGLPWLSSADARLIVETDEEWAWKRLDGPRWWARLAHALGDGLHAVNVRDHQRRRSLLSGIELRSPFFDLDLAETMLAMPPELAFDPRLSRPLQRAGVAGVLVDDVRLRPDKSYFDELFFRCVAVEDLAAIRRLLTAPDAELRAWIDLDAVRSSLLDPGPRQSVFGVRGWLKSVWRLTTAECWLREQATPGFGGELIAHEGLRPPQVQDAAPPAPVRT